MENKCVIKIFYTFFVAGTASDLRQADVRLI